MVRRGSLDGGKQGVLAKGSPVFAADIYREIGCCCEELF
jgi:hypothetical protein